MEARRSFRDELYAAADDFDAGRAVRLPAAWAADGSSVVGCYAAIRSGRTRFADLRPAVTLSGDRLVLVMTAAIRRLTDGTGERMSAADASMAVLQTVGMDGHLPVAESLGIDRWPMSRLVEAYGSDTTVAEFPQMVYAVASGLIADALAKHLATGVARPARFADAG